jgi:hypothetical protein
MNLLIQEGGNVKGLSDNWRTLPSHTLSEMLKEIETAYRFSAIRKDRVFWRVG